MLGEEVANPAAVTSGSVHFCDATATSCSGPAILANVQLTSAGTAATKLRLARLARRQPRTDTTLTPSMEAHLWAQIVDDSKRLEAIVGAAPPWMERWA